MLKVQYYTPYLFKLVMFTHHVHLLIMLDITLKFNKYVIYFIMIHAKDYT